jgi:hypothetical protein
VVRDALNGRLISRATVHKLALGYEKRASTTRNSQRSTRKPQRPSPPRGLRMLEARPRMLLKRGKNRAWHFCV